jgi:hypothetical protein
LLNFKPSVRLPALPLSCCCLLLFFSFCCSTQLVMKLP